MAPQLLMQRRKATLSSSTSALNCVNAPKMRCKSLSFAFSFSFRSMLVASGVCAASLATASVSMLKVSGGCAGTPHKGGETNFPAAMTSVSAAAGCPAAGLKQPSAAAASPASVVASFVATSVVLSSRTSFVADSLSAFFVSFSSRSFSPSLDILPSPSLPLPLPQKLPSPPLPPRRRGSHGSLVVKGSTFACKCLVIMGTWTGTKSFFGTSTVFWEWPPCPASIESKANMSCTSSLARSTASAVDKNSAG
mmetsp:Transcript_56793/g.183970  ORF Transcript_56793/g.183970 Transcript_56793/m.183970 type:complete len:251 (+) Transcript_56793:59-811(+)